MTEAQVIIVNRTPRPGAEARASRIEVKLDVSIDSESNFYAGFTEDMQECGVFVATFAPLSIGSTVDLWISLPHSAPIRASGTVRWQRPYSEVNEMVSGMGIRFDRLSAEDTARIHEFAQNRAPMFFDDEAVETIERTTLRP
jgi:uncharacterized protein (TIGR02266 family)